MLDKQFKALRRFRSNHSFLCTFLAAFVWNLVGIMLPTVACGILLQVSGLQSFVDYVFGDISKAAFSFSSASLLCVELIHGNGSKVHSGIKWGVGILLLMFSLLFSCGLAVNQILFDSYNFVRQAETSPFINIVVAFAVCVYLAAVTSTDESKDERWVDGTQDDNWDDFDFDSLLDFSDFDDLENLEDSDRDE